MRMRFLMALPTLALAAVPALAAPQPVPVEAFVEQQQFSMPRLSPDGKHLAVNVRIKRGDRTVPTMTVYTLPKLEVLSVIALPGYELPVNFFWITNERLIVQKGLEVGLREKPQATGEIVAVNLDGTKQEYLYGYKGFRQSSRGDRYGDDYGFGEVVHVPRSRDGHVLVGTYEWDGQRSMLYDINTMNAARKLVVNIPEKYLDFIVQNDGMPRFAYGWDDNATTVLYRLDDATGEWRKISDKDHGASFHPFVFTPDDKAFYASVSEKNGPWAIVREDMATGQRTAIASDPLGDSNLTEYTARPEVPFAFGTDTAIPKVRYVDANHPDAVLHKTLSGLFPNAYVHFINFTDDGQKLLFSVRSDRDPGSYYLYDRSTSKAELMLENMPQIDPADMAERRPVLYKARDGEQITGMLTLPKNPGKRRLPLVVMPHGGPFGIYDNWYFDVDAQFLASRGYAVLQPNFRGSGARGKRFELAGYRQWGGKLIDDIIDGAKWAAEQPEIDGARVCAYGWSYGGYAALMLAARAPALFKCAVGAGGVYNLSQIYTDEGVKGEKRSTSFFKKSMGEEKGLLDAQSPTTLADKITIPVLLVHGSKDKIAPIAHAEMMRDALTKAGHPPEWMEVPNEGHGFYDSEHQKQFYLKLEAFLGKYIGQ